MENTPDTLDALLDALIERANADELRAARERYSAQMDDLVERIGMIDKLLSWMGETPAPKRTDSGHKVLDKPTIEDLLREADRPGLAEGILAIMGQAEGRSEWNAELLLGHLQARGWEPRGQTPKNSVAATLSRLKSADRVHRTRAGFYSLVPPGQGSSSAATGGGDQQRLVEEGG